MGEKFVKITKWEGCYDSSWKGVITDASFAHPAKFARGLIERIFDYCLERGYLRKGDIVGDCFGGIGTGGITAAYRGLNWIGCELEPKFVALAEANFALHRSKFEAMGCPQPRIIQGDSRKFAESVSGIVSSPPYADSVDSATKGGIDWNKAGRPDRVDRAVAGVQGTVPQTYGQTAGQIGRLKAGEVSGVITSPPFIATSGGAVGSLGKETALGKRHWQGTGGERVSGNIETLKEGSVQAVVSSPPYSDIATGAGGLNTKPAKQAGQQSGRSASAASQDTDQKYGCADGQIAKLKGGSVDGVVSSPPFRDARSDTTKSQPTRHGGPCADRHDTTQAGAGYGESNGQIDNLTTGNVDGVVTSPPWENNSEGAVRKSKFNYVLSDTKGHGSTPAAKQKAMERDEQKTYGDSPGQIGKEKGETYWQAMDAVYRSCFQAIKPGGVLVLVVKDYVKAKKRVPLCDDTCRLIEHIGFTVIERVHAMLVKTTKHEDLFETNGTTSTKSRKSFFRRLAESKGSPEINFEEVLIAIRP